MLSKVEVYFLLFISYSILGWIMEVTCKLIEEKKFINRGFLIGPYCPIYGWGALAITILLRKYYEDPLALLVFGIVICSILEYTTSYVMEKVFHARWWDYSERKFNLNGRLCLGTMIPFGLLGMIIMYGINPLLYGIYSKINITMLHILCIILMLGFILDNIITLKILINIRKDYKVLKKDATEEIVAFVREKIKSHGWTYKRLLDAFPNAFEWKGKIKELVRKSRENFHKRK